MGGVEKEVEDTEVRNIGMIDKTVFFFLENAYYTINLSEQTDLIKCHKHHIVYHVIGEFHKGIETKEATIVEKLSTDIWLGQKGKVLSSIKK